MTLQRLTRDELRRAYETDLVEAFPPSELKPLSAMEILCDKGLYAPLRLTDEQGATLGYALLWHHDDGQYVLIDYLCVPARLRNQGIGAKLLDAMRAHYSPDTVFIWESEAPTGDAAQDEMILRRLAFYQRCSAVVLNYDNALFGVHFKTLCCSLSPLPDENEIMRKHQEIYLHHFGQERYDRYVQIPLLPGETPIPVTDWIEE